MMTDWPLDEKFIEMLIARKQAKVAGADFDVKGSDDIAPVVLFKDADGPVAFCFVHDIDRDHALDAMFRLTQVFSATEILCAFDSHFSSSAVNPATGQPWGEHEMQRACDEDGACSLGIITDTIAINAFRADGAEWWVNLPYHVGYTNHEVHWQEREVFHCDDKGTLVDGLIPDVARQALALPRRMDSALPFAVANGLDPRGAKLALWLDGMTAIGLDPRWTVALVLHDEDEAAIVGRALEQHDREREAIDFLRRAAGHNVTTLPKTDPFASALAKARGTASSTSTTTTTKGTP